MICKIINILFEQHLQWINAPLTLGCCILSTKGTWSIETAVESRWCLFGFVWKASGRSETEQGINLIITKIPVILLMYDFMMFVVWCVDGKDDDNNKNFPSNFWPIPGSSLAPLRSMYFLWEKIKKKIAAAAILLGLAKLRPCKNRPFWYTLTLPAENGFCQNGRRISWIIVNPERLER